MALADWEVILGGDLTLDTKYCVSGTRSLTQNFNGGATHIVHKNTYADAPLNVEVRTWMTVQNPDTSYYRFFIGGIARKQEGADTYFYILLLLEHDNLGDCHLAQASAGYYINGTQTEVASQDITQDFKDKIDPNWSDGYWRFVRILAYEIDGKFNMVLEMTPDIASPDVNNPPLDMLRSLFSVSIDIPTELQNGGACGMIVGGVLSPDSVATSAYPYYDYTQLFY